jgi:hypothetical protein
MRPVKPNRASSDGAQITTRDCSTDQYALLWYADDPDDQYPASGLPPLFCAQLADLWATILVNDFHARRLRGDVP